jgi:hypothetical protein
MKHLRGIVLLLVGGFIIYWAMEHSPKSGLGQIIGNELDGSYTMSETWYYISMILGAGIAGTGLMKIYKGR